MMTLRHITVKPPARNSWLAGQSPLMDESFPDEISQISPQAIAMAWSDRELHGAFDGGRRRDGVVGIGEEPQIYRVSEREDEHRRTVFPAVLPVQRRSKIDGVERERAPKISQHNEQRRLP